MHIEIGSSYSVVATYRGMVELYTKKIDINNVNEIYLRYLLACASTRNKKIDLYFDVSLRPMMLRVTTIDGKFFIDWKLEDFNKDDMEVLCKDLKIDPSNSTLEYFAKKLLISIKGSNIAYVPAYKLAS